MLNGKNKITTFTKKNTCTKRIRISHVKFGAGLSVKSFFSFIHVSESDSSVKTLKTLDDIVSVDS